MNRLARWAVALSLVLAATADAAIDFGVSRGNPMDCGELGRQVVRQWMSLKDFMAPGYEGERRPRSRDFQCVDPGYMANLFERPSAGGGTLRCFAHTEGNAAGYCCDRRLETCVMFSPR